MEETKKEQIEFERAFELRKFEIEHFWKRSWFFGALLIALSAGYFSMEPENQSHNCIYISFITFLVCFAQSLMNRGSKYWQERWEYFTKNREVKLGIEVTRTETESAMALYDEISMKSANFFTQAWRFSVSKITFLVWDLIAWFWLFIWIRDTQILNAFQNPAKYHCRFWAIAFHLFLVVYIFFFFFKNKKGWGFSYKNGGGGKVYEVKF